LKRTIVQAKETTMNTNKQMARVAGLLYLVQLPLSIFGILYVPSLLIVPGDATTTARNIMASASLFRLGLVINLLNQIVGIAVVLALYQVLKSVNKNMARLMVILLLVAVPIALFNELNNAAVLFLLSGAGSLNVFTADQLHALAPLFLNLHAVGLNIAGIFWGLWLLPMGYLVFTSGFLPRILGILLLIGGVGYLIDSFAGLLAPNLNVNIALLTSWGEVLFPLWLLVKGVKVQPQEKQAVAAA
jgi:hypothetical protein